MSDSNPKIHEIKRLTTPLSFNGSKALDSDGERVSCVETLSEIKYIIEPKEGLLSDDEVLQYAPESKYAAKIKMRRGIGAISDILVINNSLPWILGVYYISLICIAIPFVHWGNKTVMFLILILSILPLAYLYKITSSNSYAKVETKKPVKVISENKPIDPMPVRQSTGLESLKKYEKEANNLKALFDVKEEVVRELIEKRFAPPQITYDRFMGVVDSSHKMFYTQHESALNIINLAADDTPRIEGELESKIDNMKAIIDQIENLTNELVINISDDDGTSEEVKNLLEEMENLTGSVKEY